MSYRPLLQPSFATQINNGYAAENPAGHLSVKCMFGGEALYEIADGRFLVNDDCYLILNEQQPYVFHKRTGSYTESFCIFFPIHWAQDVYAHLVPGVGSLALDKMDSNSHKTPAFFERTYPHDADISPMLFRVHQAVRSGAYDQLWMAEQLHYLLALMFQKQQRALKQADNLCATRPATRIELYQRLHRARDYLHAQYRQTITIDELAAAVYLSPYHLIRSFKALFGLPPHAYLMHIRLERARHLLLTTEQPVTDICFAVGFSSPASFSTLFRRTYRSSPTAYRKN